MSDLQRRLYDGEKRAGWDPSDANTFAEEIAHLHEEVSEAFRAWRLTKDVGITYEFGEGKPTGVPVELADALIGMFYMAERWGFDLLDAVEIKHQWNLGRSYADEGRRLHEPVVTDEAQVWTPDTIGSAFSPERSANPVTRHRPPQEPPKPSREGAGRVEES